MPSIIEWKADASGRVTHVTRGWQFVTGQPVDDALGDGWGAMIHPDDLGTLRTRWLEDVGRVVPFAATFRVVTRTGEAVWMESRGNPTKEGWSGWCTPLLQQGCATLPVGCITGFETSEPTMGEKRGIEYLVIDDDGLVGLRTADAGEARAYYLGSEKTVSVFSARLKWAPSPRMPQGGGLSEGARTLPGVCRE